jgi:hypothetical protein
MSDARPRNSTRLVPARRRGQAIVEFGLVALLFTLLLMGTVDFAILLNGWLGVSSTARDIARQLAVGLCPPTATENYGPGVSLLNPANHKCQGDGLSDGGSVPNAQSPSGVQIQGLDAFGPYTTGAGSTCSATTCSIRTSPASTTLTANQFAGGTITFTSGANAGTSREISASTAYPPSPEIVTLSSALPKPIASGDTFSIRMVKVNVGVCSSDTTTCYNVTSPATLLNFYPPATNGAAECPFDDTSGCTPTPVHPTPNDSIVVTVVAKVQVVTPLVRPFFGCINGNNPRCEVSITSRAVARFEGPYI